MAGYPPPLLQRQQSALTGPPLARGSRRSLALTIAARGADAGPHPQGRSRLRQTPSSNLSTAGRRRSGSAALNNGRLGLAGASAPGLRGLPRGALRPAQLPGPESGRQEPKGAGAPTTTPPRRGAHRRGRLSQCAPPGNPTGSLPDWPGRSGRDLHVKGRAGSLRFENGFRTAGAGLHSGPLGNKGTNAHTVSLLEQFTVLKVPNSFSAPHFERKNPKVKYQL